MRMRRRKRKNNTFCTLGVVATGTKLLDTKYAFYGFNDDLIKTIN